MAIRASLAVLAALGLSLLPQAAAQSPAQPAAQSPHPKPPADYRAPRTPFGHPSLEGVWTQNFIILMESTPQAPMLTLPEGPAKAMAAQVGKGIGDALDRGLDPEVPELMKAADGLPIVRGERRTRVVVLPEDGKLPYTPEARRESARGPQNPRYDNPEERPYWERCITSLGLPPVTGMGTTSVNPRHIVQTANHVVVHTEYGEEARIIPYAATHKPKMLQPAIGDAIARWEGETLVVETIGMHEHDRVRFFSNLVVSAEAKVTERFTRLSDKELLYQYTIEDPKVYTAPWLAEYSLYKTNQRMFEHACHEGNYSLPHILQAQRVKDARTAAAAPAPAAKPPG